MSAIKKEVKTLRVLKFNSLIICFLLLFSIVIIGEAVAATYYASPIGGGDGSSTSSPLQIADFWSLAKPGDTLFLLDGRYTGQNSMVNPPTGMPDNITIKALNNGEVLIDGEYVQNRVIDIGGTRWTLEGIFACCSSKYYVIELSGDNNTLRKVIAWDASKNNPEYYDEILAVNGCTGCLIEDSAFWGTGRKAIGGWGDTNTTIRRVFARWTYMNDDPNISPTHYKLGVTDTYDSDNRLIENLIATWDERDFTIWDNGQREGIIGSDGQRYKANQGAGNKILGSIIFSLSSQNGRAWALLKDNGSSERPDEPLEIKDVVLYTDKSPSAETGTFYVGSGIDRPYTASYITSIGGKSQTNASISVLGNGSATNIICMNSAGMCTYGNWAKKKLDYVMYYNNQTNWDSPPTNYAIQNPDLLGTCGDILQYGCTEAQRPKVNGQSVGAQIKYRYVDGILTSEPLWPWPINDLIKKAMQVSGYDVKGGIDGKGGIDLTKTVFELGGGTLPDFNVSSSFNFSLSNSGNKSIIQGSSISNTISASLISGTTQSISYSVSGLPSGATASFSLTSCSPACSTTLTINTSASAPTGTYTITVKGIGGITKTTSFSLTVSSSSPPSSITSLKTAVPITIDGNLSEEVWSKATSITFSNTSKSDNQVRVYTLYDDTNLYFAYDVIDAHREATNVSLWADDGAEIYIDTGNNKTIIMDADDYNFIININGLISGGDINAKTINNSKGYTMEIAIPWTTIKTTPIPDKTMGLLLGNNDRDNGTSAQFDWLNLIETGSYARPNLWGDIILFDMQGGKDLSPPLPPTALTII